MSRKNSKRRQQHRGPSGTAPKPDRQAHTQTPMGLYRSAQEHRERGDYQRAIADLRRLLAREPEARMAHIMFAECSVLIGRHQQALDAYDHVLAGVKPDEEHKSYTVLSGKAVALSQMHRHQEAEEVADRIIALAPQWHMAWMQRGSIRLDQDDHAGALEDVRHAMTLKEDDPNLHCMMGEIYVNMAIHRTEHPHPDCDNRQNIEDARSAFHQGMHHLHTAADLGHQHAARSMEHFINHHAAELHIGPGGEDLQIP